MSIREKVLFIISKSLLKRKHHNSSSEKEVSIEKLERNVQLGFIFSLIGVVMPLFIIPALIVQHKAFKHRKELSKNSRRKLIFTEIVGIIWLLVTTYIAVKIAIMIVTAALASIKDAFEDFMLSLTPDII